MKSLDKYEQDERSFGYWARIHANQCQHSWEQFLTWHRAYLYFFEQQLQDVDPTVTLPYWDWASYRADLEISITDMGSNVALDNGIIPEAYRCWIDQAGLDELKTQGLPESVLDKLVTVVNQKFDSGNRLFLKAGINWADDPRSDQAIIAALEKINPLWHYQRWPGGNSSIIFEAYPRPEDVERILQLDNFFSFGSGPADNHFFGALENIHNLIHNFSGGLNPNFGDSTEPMNTENPQAGDMVNAGRTAFDPIFWGHHANCDRLWAEWQKAHTKSGPDDPDDVLPPWNMTVEQTYNTAKLGYQYMQSSHVFPASSQIPIARFVSAPAAVHPKVTATHRKAEVRLDRVQYSTRAGFFIRVFPQPTGRQRLYRDRGQSALRRDPQHVHRNVHRRSGSLRGAACPAGQEVRPPFAASQDAGGVSYRRYRGGGAIAGSRRNRFPGDARGPEHRRHTSDGCSAP